MGKIKIGILDFGYRKKNISGVNILHDVFEYASVADSLGFSSFWLGEHHNSGQAWSTPEILIPLIAGYTKNIRIGAGGILLGAHSPYRVALNFKLLESLFPGRIDLGLANGATEERILQKLNPGKDELGHFKNFGCKLDELIAYLSDDQKLWDNEKIIIPPFNGVKPRIWRLSSSWKNLQSCVALKLNYSKSTFHFGSDESITKEEIMDLRKAFHDVNSSHIQINLAVTGICYERHQQAKKVFNQLKLNERENSHAYIVGSPATFQERIYKIVEETGIEEFIFYDQSKSFRRRAKTLELIAKEFNLS